MSNYALAGYYGFGNAGDDAILTAIVGEIRRHEPEASITVITYPYGDTARVAEAEQVEALDGRDLQAVQEAIGHSDILVIGGGGLIQDYLPSDPQTRFSSRHGNLAFWVTLAILARAAGTPVATWSLGVGPLATEAGRAEAGLFFSQVGHIDVRDEASAALVRQLGADVEPALSADPVFLLQVPDGDPIESLAEVEDIPTAGARRVAVSVRAWDGPPGWEDAFAAALDDISERLDADILFVPFQHAGKGLANDGLVSTRIAARMRRVNHRAVTGAELSPREKLAVLAKSDLVVGMRLHSIVFAAIAGVPCVGVSYDPKVENTMRQLGVERFSIPLAELTSTRLVESALIALEESPAMARPLVDRAASAWVGVSAFMRTPVLPPITESALEAATEAAVARSAEVTAIEASRDAAIIARKETQGDLDHYREAYDKLASEYQAVLDSRAVKMVRSLWAARSRLGSLPAAAASGAKEAAKKVLPLPARKALRSAVGRPAPAGNQPDYTADELEGFRERIESELDHIHSSHPDAPGFVILPPGIGWDVELFQRPQQMALAFARLGYPVIYHLEPKYALGHVGYRSRGEGIYVGFVPDELTDLLHRIPEPIFPSYVYNFDWRRHLERPSTVYEHIDDLEVFEHVYPRSKLDEWHQRALTEAEVVAASAIDLLNDVKQNRPDSVLVPNGVDYGHFAGTGDLETPGDLAGLEGPIVGYYGALAEWFDYDLVGQAARRMPRHQFVLIGPDYDGTASASPTLSLPNVHWLGPKPYRELPAYLDRFDVATVPFVVSEVTHAVSPLKLFEYMAGGKPVVTPPLRECARYRAVQIGEGVDGFIEAIERAIDLGKDPSHIDLLRRTARANTWDSRVRTVIEAVERAKASKR